MRISERYFSAALILILAVVSALVGIYWGQGAQFLYMSGTELPMFGNGVECYEYLGEITGGVFGLLTGVLFGVWLKRYLADGCNSGRAVGMEAVAGILCSTMVHVVLMICYGNSHFGPLLIGAIFGAISGVIIGGTSEGVCVYVYYRWCDEEESDDGQEEGN